MGTDTSLGGEITDAVNALSAAKRKAFQAFNGTEAIDLFRAIRDVRRARAVAAAQLARLPAETFALAGVTPRDGWLMTLTGSSKHPSGWQLTRFGRNGLPYTDNQYMAEELVRAIDDFLLDCSLREVFGIDLALDIDSAPMAAPAPAAA